MPTGHRKDTEVKTLELKIPPPVVAIVLVALMWFLAWLTPSLSFEPPARRFVVWALVLCALCIGLPATTAFRRARTTVHPMHPEQASTLVTSGVYRFTRNPMYVGILLLLAAVAAHLGSVLALLGLPAFVFWIGRFQIAPEERALRAKFGSAYDDYTRAVRRWL